MYTLSIVTCWVRPLKVLLIPNIVVSDGLIYVNKWVDVDLIYVASDQEK
jgi:hypothetical protein